MMDYDKCNIKLSIDSLFAVMSLSIEEITTINTNIDTNNYFVKSSRSNGSYACNYIYDNNMFISFSLTSAGGNFKVKYFSRFIQSNTIDGLFLATSKMLARLGVIYSVDILKVKLMYSEGHLAADIIGSGGFEATRIMEDVMSGLYNNTSEYAFRTTSKNEIWSFGSKGNTEFSTSSCSFKNTVLKGQLIINQYDKLQEIIVHSDNNDYWFGLYSNFGVIDREVLTYIREASENKDKARLYKYCLENGYGIYRLEFQIKKKFFQEHKRGLPKITTLFDFMQRPATIFKFILDKIFCICNNEQLESPVKPYAIIRKNLMETIEDGEIHIVNCENGIEIYNQREEANKLSIERKCLATFFSNHIKKVSMLNNNINGSFLSKREISEYFEELLQDVNDGTVYNYDYLDRFQG